MEITNKDILLANNTLAIDNVCRQKEYLTEYEIKSRLARIENIENRISENQQYLKQLNDELVNFKNLHSELEDKHSRLIQERREMLGQTK